MTTYTPSLLHGSCECGTCSFDVRVTPTARFICHCKICQAFTGKPYSDVIVLPAKHVELANADQISFKKYRPLPTSNADSASNVKNQWWSLAVLEPSDWLSFQ